MKTAERMMAQQAPRTDSGFIQIAEKRTEEEEEEEEESITGEVDLKFSTSISVGHPCLLGMWLVFPGIGFLAYAFGLFMAGTAFPIIYPILGAIFFIVGLYCLFS